MHQMLDATDIWVRQARALPRGLKDRRLAMESAVIVALARKLSTRLRRGDPLATRVKLSKFDFLAAFMEGVFVGLFARA